MTHFSDLVGYKSKFRGWATEPAISKPKLSLLRNVPLKVSYANIGQSYIPITAVKSIQDSVSKPSFVSTAFSIPLSHPASVGIRGSGRRRKYRK